MLLYPDNQKNVKLIEEITAGLVKTTYIGRINRSAITPATSDFSRSILKIVETDDWVGTITQEFFLPVNVDNQPKDTYEFARDDRATLTYQ